MQNLLLKSLLALSFLLSPVSASASSNLSDITFYTENYPPANYIENGEIKGISVDTIKAIWQHLNIPEQDILIAPWSRGYRFTLDNANTALFTMSRTQPRENLFKWVGPIFHSTHVLIAKKSKKLKFSSLGQVFYHKVATVQGDISEISMYQVGFPASNMASVSQLKQAFLMMESDRVDMMAVSIHGFSHLTDQLGFDANDYEQVWEVNKIGNYFAFNINTPDKVIQAYQKAFDEIKEQRLQIKEAYELPQADY